MLIVVRRITDAMNAGMRCVGVAIAICSWVTTSNHCAFAAQASKIASMQKECPFHSKPSKQKEPSSQLQCCKILRALVPTVTKSWARDDARCCDVDLPIEFHVVFSQPHTGVLLSLDTGPPVAVSFAELILQRSLLSHAPPLLA